MADIVRVLRILEYVGPRKDVEEQLLLSIHGERNTGSVVIRAATIGSYPEILDAIPEGKTEVEHPESIGKTLFEHWLDVYAPEIAACPINHDDYVGKCPACHTKLPKLSERMQMRNP